MAKVKIKDIRAHEVLNSSGQATLSIEVVGDNGLFSSMAYAYDNYNAPFAVEDRKDGDSRRYKGLGRLDSLGLVKKKVLPALLGLDISSQLEIDKKLTELNGKDHKLGSAIVFCTSVACARLAAISANQELFFYLSKTYKLDKVNKEKLPIPIFNIFNGGDTGDTNLDFQEFLLIPKRDKSSEMIRKGAEVFAELADVLKESGLDTDTGQEGGYAPEIDSSIEAVELMMTAIIRSSYKPGRDFNLGLDIGSSILYDKITGKYLFSFDKNYFSPLDLSSLYKDWLRKYPITYLEDAFSEYDWKSWSDLNEAIGSKLLISGDDMISSNINRLRESVNQNALNTVVLKPAKAGTLSDSIEFARLARERSYNLVVSGLNHENNDSFITDLAVACSANYLKAGSLSRGERVVKYNRLVEIDNSL